MNRNIKTLSLVLLFALLSACSSTEETTEVAESNQQQATYDDPRDPLESFNRTMWDFNWNVLDKHILRPLSVAYVDYVPTPVRSGLYNMAENLDEPSSAVSNVLQGKFGDAANDTGRFLVNSTIGLLGLFDVAHHMGMERKQEEMSEAFGSWGIGTGPFLMLPGLGPTDPRNLAGDYIDSSYFPLSELNIYTSLAKNLIKALETRAELRSQEQLIYESLDSYTLMKDIYLQKVESDVNDGEVILDESEEEDLDAYLDEID